MIIGDQSSSKNWGLKSLLWRDPPDEIKIVRDVKAGGKLHDDVGGQGLSGCWWTWLAL